MTDTNTSPTTDPNATPTANPKAAPITDPIASSSTNPTTPIGILNCIFYIYIFSVLFVCFDRFFFCLR